MSKKIVMLDSKFIRQVRVYGPIPRPSIYSDDVIKSLIADGHSVYEKLADGSIKQLTLDDFAIKVTSSTKPVEVKEEVKPVEVKKEVVEETSTIDGGEVFNGLSETSAPVMPVKEDAEPSTATMTKAQRKAQKKAKLEAAKEAEETAE